MTTLYKIDGSGLVPVKRSSLANEAMLQGWVAKDPSIVGLDVLVIGREVTIENGGRIDILAIDREGDLSIIELKRDRTPREVIAQVLDYASWVAGLTTKDVHEIANRKLNGSLTDAFKERFETSLPETLNGNHNMVIVASEFDASSERIVKYLANVHGVAINTAFFTIFEENGQQLLATDWLMDQQQVVERSESKKKAPWTGYYYVNAGDDTNVRWWEDMRQFGFIAAGYGRFYSQRLEQLSAGDPVYVYQKGQGYVGFGIVRSPSVMAKDFVLSDGRSLSEVHLRQPNILHDPDDPEIADYVVGVEWKKTVPIADAKTFSGVFANQNVVCKLTHPATLDFLATEFGSVDADE
ncbi:PDDEXK family nuclease [Nisaea sediminum]|uniref:endonuclease NucS domain-containing protein n=1 Tax=Nisaea sediminum TaxID=2775867 RepID=UPI0018667C95|nr:endonuclease NucS domain-containing protein [Nisaea sediminum]